MNTVPRMVVGVDGFESSKAALRPGISRQAGSVLVEAAEGADLLVVGNRGLGGLAEALLGSVAGNLCRASRNRLKWRRGPDHRSGRAGRRLPG
jgi:nucleotide-binding universal stress UspA family protein